MSSPALLGHATTLTLPTTGASARLLRPDARLLLVRGLSSAAAATPHAAASPGLACSRHSSVAAAPSTSPQRAGGGGSSDLVALTLTAVRLPPAPVSRLSLLFQRVLAAAAPRVSTSDSARIQIRESSRWLPDEHRSDFRH